MTEPQLPNSGQPTVTRPTEEWGDEEEGSYDEEEDEDIDAEAEEIARRLGEELWADINKAQADRAGVASSTTQPSLPTRPVGTTPSSPNHRSRKDEAAILTMKAILTYIKTDSLAHSTLASTVVPESGGENILDILNRTVASGTVPREVAMPLSHILVTLARSNALFGTLRHSNAPSIQLDRGKRKREQTDDGRAYKKPFMPHYDLQTQVNEAVRVVTQALSATSPAHTLDPSLIASIQLQLHQIFLFAVTSSAGGGPDMNALQEISGLIQVVGVLSGIHIGPTQATHPSGPSALHQHSHSFPPNTSASWPSSTNPTAPPPVQITDIGTAVYPCHVPGCRKMFSRLFSLRAHQRIHSAHRPFRCAVCPASFARNHDLKRHSNLHDRKAWKCCGCEKMFSRRDAIKRHKNSNKTRGAKGVVCVDAEVQEVELDDQEGGEVVREERRAKLWSEIAGGHGSGLSVTTVPGGYNEGTNMEEGEVQSIVISGIQSAVMSLHGLLQGHVANALGTPSGQAISPPLDPTGGQATLASVIARAQLQNQKLAHEAQSLMSSIISRSPAPSATSDATSNLLSQQPHSPNDDIANQGSENHAAAATPSLSVYGLSDEQTKMLEQAIANAASAAQAQAEAEAALEEEEEDGYDQDEEEYGGSEGQPDADSVAPTG